MLEKLRQLADDADLVLALMPDEVNDVPVWQIWDFTNNVSWDKSNCIAEASTVEECLIFAESKLR